MLGTKGHSAGDVNWSNSHGKQPGDFSDTRNRPNLWVISLLGVYPKETKTSIRRDLSIPTFKEAQFVILKTLKESRYPTTDVCHMNMYMYMKEYLLDYKKWSHLLCVILDETSQHHVNSDKPKIEGQVPSTT